MKHSELTAAFIAAFGETRGPALQRDLALTALSSQSAFEAAEAGESPQLIWLAVCSEMELSEEWRFPHRMERAKN